MSIRIKILILLLVVSVLPLTVMGVLDHRATKKMMADLTTQGTIRQTEKLTRDLERSVAMTTMIMAQNQALIESTVEQLALSVERRILAGSEPDTTRTQILPLSAFRQIGTAPPGMTANEDYMIVSADGLSQPLSISYETPVWSLAPGVSPEQAAEQLAVTAGLGRKLKKLFADGYNSGLWLRVGFANGLMVSYPGHGAIEATQDFRGQYWFAETLEQNEPSWFYARPDPVTGQYVLSHAIPIRDGTGTNVAVAVMDVTLRGPLSQIRGLTEVPEGRSFIVDIPYDGPGAGLPAVVAGEDADGKALGFVPIPGVDTDDLARLGAAMLAEPNGVVRQPFEGSDALWSWGALDDDGTAILMIAPFSVIGDQLAAMQNVLEDEAERVIASGLLIFVVMVLIVIAVAFQASKGVSGPVLKLSKAAAALAKGDFSVRAEVSGSDEIAHLAKTFNETVPALKQRLQYQKSMQLAEEVQQNLLPDSPVQIPGFSVAGQILYCDETGGDYFDFIPLDDDKTQGPLAVLLGDVSGHGVASALLMTTARAQLRALKTTAIEPGPLLTQVNQHLSQDIQAGRFMTMVMLVLEPGQNTIHWANAGHIPPLVCRASTGARLDLERGGIPLGIESSWRYDTVSSDYLAEGDLLVIATDGLWDCANTTGEVFGEARYRDFVKTRNHLDAEAFVSALIKTVEDFRDQAPRVDDITVVAIKRVS